MTKEWKERTSSSFTGSKRRGSSQERWASMVDPVACGYIAAGGNTGSWNSTTRSMVMSPSVHRLIARYLCTDPPSRQRENATSVPACRRVQGEQVDATSCHGSGNPFDNSLVRAQPTTY